MIKSTPRPRDNTIRHILMMLAVCFTLFSVSNQALANVNIDVSLTDERVSLGEAALYIEDPEHVFSIDHIRDLSEPLVWRGKSADIPNFGYTRSAFWFRVDLVNSSDARVDRLIEVAYPVLDYIDFYLVQDGEIKDHVATGDQLPYENRAVGHRNFVFPFSLEAQSEGKIFIHIKSSSSIQLPISVASERSFFETDEKNLIGLSIYLGMMLVMILFNLFIFSSLRETMYLYYVCFVFSFAAVQLCLTGLPAQYVIPNHAYLQDFGILFFVPSIVLFASLFARKFLSLKQYAPRWDKTFKFLAWVSGVCLIGAFTLPYDWSIRVSLLAVVPASTACLVIGPYLWSKGHTIARFYTMAWASITIATVFLALSKFGVIPRTFWTEHGLQFGSAIGAVLLALALADRFNSERDQRFEAQTQMLAESQQREIVEQELIYTALHDPLTDMPNRAFFENWFSEHVKDQPQYSLSLGMFHLTRFHEVNKTLGHFVAEELLMLIAQRLNEFVGQVKGAVPLTKEKDQFIVAIEDVSFVVLLDQKANFNPAETFRNITRRLCEPMEFRGLAIDLGCVCGIAHYPSQGEDGHTLLRNAHIAIDMCEAQSKLVAQYSEDINPYNERRLTLAGELRKAIENSDLEIYYQPKIDAGSGRVNGMEALLRWNHPEYGMVPPDEFIPIAEQTGVIHPLTMWVIDQALCHLGQTEDPDRLNLAVNISAINLKARRFPETVRELLALHGTKPHQLSLEVTETSMMDEPERALEALVKLNELGVRLSIDDFGTGYSSLAYIKQLPVQEIKIDRSFVMEMDTQENDSIIVKTTIAMAHSLGYKVVAEGVETKETLQRLGRMGCDYLQGYHICKPLPFDQFQAFIQERNQDNGASGASGQMVG